MSDNYDGKLIEGEFSILVPNQHTPTLWFHASDNKEWLSISPNEIKVMGVPIDHTTEEGRAAVWGALVGWSDSQAKWMKDKAAAAERERIAAWLEGLWLDSCICEPITINDEGVTTPSDYLAAAVRNGEHETGKAKAQED